VIYSSHKPYSLAKWATGHQWHYSGNIAGQIGTAIPRGRLTAWNQALPVIGLTLRGSVIPPSAPIHTPNRSIPVQIVSLALRSKRLIRPAKCEARVQHDKGDEQRSVLNRHRRKLQAHKKSCCPTFCPVSIYLSTLVIFMIASIAKSIQVNTYSCRWQKITDFYWSKQAKHLTRS
jgi:hypothetical protein